MAAEKAHVFDWMKAPETIEIVDIFESSGASIRFVGGCVRDSLLGRPVNDIDIATDILPETVVRLIHNAGHRTVPVGLDHGTVLAVIGPATFEITTLRHDVETDGRHAKVAFTDDWVADAARRDLTFNALSVEPDGTLHDPFGGLKDLQNGYVRFVGEAETRLTEDVLRLLRYYRFFAFYGRPPADDEARQACRAKAPLLPRLSGERIRRELLKLMSAPDPVPTVTMMSEDGIFLHLFEAQLDIPALSKLVQLENRYEAGAVAPIRRMAALIQATAGELEVIAETLRLSNAERDYLTKMQTHSNLISNSMPTKELDETLYRFGIPIVTDLILLAWARSAAEDGWPALLMQAQSWKLVTFPLSGRDVTALGVERGPLVGAYLRDVENWWIAAGFEPDRTACLQHLRHCVQDGQSSA